MEGGHRQGRLVNRAVRRPRGLAAAATPGPPSPRGGNHATNAIYSCSEKSITSSCLQSVAVLHGGDRHDPARPFDLLHAHLREPKSDRATVNVGLIAPTLSSTDLSIARRHARAYAEIALQPTVRRFRVSSAVSVRRLSEGALVCTREAVAQVDVSAAGDVPSAVAFGVRSAGHALHRGRELGVSDVDQPRANQPWSSWVMSDTVRYPTGSGVDEPKRCSHAPPA
jgi:hypothetical protein